MKNSTGPLYKALIGLGAALILTGGGIAIATNLPSHPASSVTPAPPTIELAQPAADSDLSPTVEQAVGADADRAETAAGQAESAAKVAVAAAERAQATTTTTTVAPATMAAPTTTTTTVAAPVVEVTTTTTVAPKAWVEVGRFPMNTGDSPARLAVTLQTGQVRITGLIAGGIVWLGDGDLQAGCGSAPVPGTLMASYNNHDCVARSDWPLGEQVLSGGHVISGMRTGGFDSSRPVIVEEYR